MHKFFYSNCQAPYMISISTAKTGWCFNLGISFKRERAMVQEAKNFAEI